MGGAALLCMVIPDHMPGRTRAGHIHQPLGLAHEGGRSGMQSPGADPAICASRHSLSATPAAGA